MAENIGRGTQVHAPDLDWSQIRETVLMLELSAGQIDAAMHESNEAVSVLTGSFTQLAELMQTIDASLAALPKTAETSSVRESALRSASAVTQIVQQSVIAFQFYDKLSQRLDHVCQSMASLSGLVGDNNRLYNPAEWQALQRTIRAKYSMVEEVAMFDAVLSGMPVKAALEKFVAERKQQASNDIELF